VHREKKEKLLKTAWVQLEAAIFLKRLGFLHFFPFFRLLKDETHALDLARTSVPAAVKRSAANSNP